MTSDILLLSGGYEVLRTLKVSGYKNFKRSTVELDELKAINILVGINGSGKSSILEILALTAKFGDINSDSITSDDNSFPNLYSLFAPETGITMRFDSGDSSYRIVPTAGNVWRFEKQGQPESGRGVIAIWNTVPFSSDGGNANNRPFGDIQVIGLSHASTEDLEEAQELLSKAHPSQRVFSRDIIRGVEYLREKAVEIIPERLSGGHRYIGMLINAMNKSIQSNNKVVLIDDLGDSVYPALRKVILPSLIEKQKQDDALQVFATTHNIEIVKTALDHPDRCSVYMFDYDGSLVEFAGGEIKKVESSRGIQSSESMPAISKMLGLVDLDLGFPEIVILCEEETKRTFLQSLNDNQALSQSLKSFEVQVPFQQGDGNVSRAINNMLDLSKYLFFSEIWSDRYVIFTDHNSIDYEPDGTVKQSSNQHRKALAIAQKKLKLGSRFLLTRKGETYVESIEETYPDRLWEEFKHQKNLNDSTSTTWLRRQKNKGEAKNELADFVAKNITRDEFISSYPELANILLS